MQLGGLSWDEVPPGMFDVKGPALYAIYCADVVAFSRGGTRESLRFEDMSDPAVWASFLTRVVFSSDSIMIGMLVPPCTFDKGVELLFSLFTIDVAALPTSRFTSLVPPSRFEFELVAAKLIYWLDGRNWYEFWLEEKRWEPTVFSRSGFEMKELFLDAVLFFGSILVTSAARWSTSSVSAPLPL